MDQTVLVVKDWILPIVAVVMSIWFASAAKKDAEKAEKLLQQITNAVEGWQNQIMESVKSILDSSPQVIEGRSRIAHAEAAKMLISTLQTAIQQSASNPQPGAMGHTQMEQQKEMGRQLAQILESMK